jgi:hypothetical protein
MMFTDDKGTHINAELVMRWNGARISPPFLNCTNAVTESYVFLTVANYEKHTLRGQEAERFMDWVEQKQLPNYCFDCGAFLKGGATEHKPECTILGLIHDALEVQA